MVGEGRLWRKDADGQSHTMHPRLCSQTAHELLPLQVASPWALPTVPEAGREGDTPRHSAPAKRGRGGVWAAWAQFRMGRQGGLSRAERKPIELAR